MSVEILLTAAYCIAKTDKFIVEGATVAAERILLLAGCTMSR